MKLNNKGFTLVELLAVLVILIAISSIAIPTISSSLERSKDKQTKAKEKLLLSAAELYITDHRNAITTTSDYCYIKEEQLITEKYIDKDENEIDRIIKYDIDTKELKIVTSSFSIEEHKCVN